MDNVFVRKALAISVASVCACTLALPAVLSPKDAFATQATVQKIKDKQAEAEEVRNKLVDLGTQVEKCNNDIYNLEQQLEESKKQIAQLTSDIDRTQKELEVVQGKLANRVAANYKVGASSLLSVLVGSDSFEDLISRVYYYQSIADSEAKMIQKSKDLKKQLEDSQTALEQRKAEQEQLIEQNKQRVSELEAYMAESQSILDNLDSEIKTLIEQKVAEEEAAAQAAYQRKVEEEAKKAAEKQAKAEEAKKAAEAAEAAAKADPQNKQKQEEAKKAQQLFNSAKKDSDKAEADVSRKRATGSNSNIVSIARNYIGYSYSTYDCSKLAQSVYRDAGISIPRSSAAQWAAAKANGWAIDPSDMRPGDLIYYTSPGGGGVNHVAIYSGNGKAIQAYRPGRVSGEGDYTLNGTKRIVGVARPH